MLPRFYLPGAAPSATALALPDDEAGHLARVLRLKAGDAVRVFDGRGREWLAAVEEVRRGQASVRIGKELEAAPEPTIGITLAIAVLKADHMDDVIRDAVMMGVSAIVPLITERTEVTLRVIERADRVSRWQRIAVASAKQCGRAVVPAVAHATTLAAALNAAPSGSRIVLVEPSADSGSVTVQQIARAEAIELFIGPEGGWAAAELRLAREAGGILVTVGRQTLRAVAAPIVAVTALRALWQDL